MPDEKIITREILLAFWKIHILHHAAEDGIYGQWMLEELRHHGYKVSPGTLYPILNRMERFGWLCSDSPASGSKARRVFRITEKGRAVLRTVQDHLLELGGEVADNCVSS
ncbi:MAG: helix-turn-helix transcriptional regulator [Armatimonadetes bacterium]|nr:helix-turn-helix transcriptional regulator [Armatimonadota bacterium]